MKFVLCYLIFINLLSVIVCILDKNKAKKGKWRVSEKTLFGLSVIGGSVAMYFTMKAIRHKTHHKRFMIGLPIIIVLQSAIMIYVFYRFT